MEGATTAYKGRKSMVNAKEPGIAVIERAEQRTQRNRGGRRTGHGVLCPQAEEGTVFQLVPVKRSGDLLGHQGRFSQDGQEHREIEHGPPVPVARVEPGRLLEVAPKQDDGEPKQDLRRRREGGGGTRRERGGSPHCDRAR